MRLFYRLAAEAALRHVFIFKLNPLRAKFYRLAAEAALRLGISWALASILMFYRLAAEAALRHLSIFR